MYFRKILHVLLFSMCSISVFADVTEFLEWEELFLSGSKNYNEVLDMAGKSESAGDYIMAAGLWQLAGDFIGRDDIDTGRRWYEKSLNLLEKSDRTHQLYYTLKMGGQTKKLIGKGPAAFIRSAPGIQKTLDEAMERDSDDARTRLFWAQSKINAPRLFGGNFKQGVSVLESLADDVTNSKTIRFTAFSLLSSVWEKKGKESLSEKYRLEALSIFPDTWITSRAN